MKIKIQQNMIRGFVITALVLLTWSCQNSSNQSNTATITGSTLVEGDKFQLKYNTFNFSFYYGEFEIQENGDFNGELIIPEPVFGEARIVNGRRPVKTFPLYVTPGSTLKLNVSEKDVTFEGELKKENEFLREFKQEVSMGTYKYYNSTNFDDFKKIDALIEKSKASISEAQLQEKFKEYVQSWLQYLSLSLKYKIIAKADKHNLDIPEEVIAFINETSNEKFSTSAVLGTLEWRTYIDNYFKVQNKFKKHNSEELADRFTKIENTYIKDRYALYLSNKLINSRDGMDGTCRKQVESILPFVKFENTKSNIDSLLNQLSVYESEYKHLLKGEPAPGFTFEDVNGKMVSLSDFKGKYVFLDVWNIYCGPCIAQIPYIRKYEEELKDDNIVFIAVSCDKQKEKQKWRDFVIKKEMVGHQLIMDKGRDSQFLSDYNIKGFPTFMIIDPEGNMVEYKYYYPENKKFFPTLLDIIK
jgi:thiol-disulfide isomerase/thioredoxin